MKRHALAALGLVVGATLGSAGGDRATADGGGAAIQPADDAVLHWNEVAGEAALITKIAPDFDPLHESRMYAMMHLAIHDALNAIERRFEPYAMDIGPLPAASIDAAVAVAARDVMIPVLAAVPDIFTAPDVAAAQAMVEAAYTEALAGVPAGDAKDQGMAIGRAAAQVVLAMRTGDGADEGDYLDRSYPEGDDPGEYRYPAGTDFAAAPLWGEVTPFVYDDIERIRPRPPHALSGRQYAKDFDELKLMGELHSEARTPDETEIAHFWRESSPLRWNRIARTVVGDRGLDVWEHARLFALLNMALSDGYVANWDSKYHYNRWRPETAVQRGDDDTNPGTDGDPDWLPEWPNGATPEYDSGHSIEGAAAAEVMQRVLSTDRLTFSVCSYTMLDDADECTGATPTLRTYHRLSDASAENGWSRILLGWHFRNAVEVGAQRGARIGADTVRGLLRPAH